MCGDAVATHFVQTQTGQVVETLFEGGKGWLWITFHNLSLLKKAASPFIYIKGCLQN